MSSNKLDHLQGAKLGAYGTEIVAATGSSSTGPFIAIQCVVSGTLSAITGVTGAPALTGTFTAVTFPANAVIYGAIQSFTVGGSGTFIGYKGDPLV